MQQATKPTKPTGQTLNIREAPDFERGRPPRDATIYRISLSPSRAFTLLCDIGHLYPSPTQRPSVGAMLEHDGAWTLYAWPQADPDSRLLILMIQYGAARLADASQWYGQAWISGDLLARILAKLTHRAHWDLTVDGWTRPVLVGRQPGLLLDLEREVAK